MKIPFMLFLAIIYLSHAEEVHKIVLNPSGSTIDNIPLVEEAINGASEIPNSVLISEPGIYVLQGEYIGHVYVKLPNKTSNATIILNGINITNPNGPGIVIVRAREIDNYKYSQKDPITYEKAQKIDFANAGIRIIINDDTENMVNAGHDEDYDGAFFSTVSMVIDSGVKNNGKLTIIADSEGLDTKKHMQINGGIIKIVASDDGINGSKEYGSLIEINGGILRINGGQSLKRGDGIDCNGMLIINGGDVVASGYERVDSGLDGTSGLIINGGFALGTGSSMDKAGEFCKQPTMNLKFSFNMDPKSVFTITDSKENIIVKFSPSDIGFIEGSILHGVPAMTISHPKFETFKVYKMFIDGKLLGYSSNKAMKGTGGFDPIDTRVEEGSNMDKRGENYYKINLNNVLEKGENNDGGKKGVAQNDEPEYHSIFLLSRTVENFSGITEIN